MADLNAPRRKPVWPWIIAALLVLALIWGLSRLADDDGRRDAAVTPPEIDAPATTTTTPPVSVDPELTAEAALERYSGTFANDTLTIDLDANGTYTLQQAPAESGSGRWSHDAASNVLRLVPADGSAERVFRIDSASMLTPLDADGQPDAQTAQLQRQA
jgi:hypothetical protein